MDTAPSSTFLSTDATFSSTLRQLRQDAAAATAAHAAARGAERLLQLAAVMDLRKREVAACAEQRARLEREPWPELRDPPAGLPACMLEQSIAAAGAASAWLLLAQDGAAEAPPGGVAECRDRARAWLAEAEHRCTEAFFHDLALAQSPAALAARDAVLGVKAGLELV
jgi:hypothetical protein